MYLSYAQQFFPPQFYPDASSVCCRLRGGCVGGKTAVPASLALPVGKAQMAPVGGDSSPRPDTGQYQPFAGRRRGRLHSLLLPTGLDTELSVVLHPTFYFRLLPLRGYVPQDRRFCLSLFEDKAKQRCIQQDIGQDFGYKQTKCKCSLHPVFRELNIIGVFDL